MANPSKTIYAITPASTKGGKPYWNKIGVGFTNNDGSINIKLFGLPVNGECQMRDFVPRDEYDASKQGYRASKSEQSKPRDENDNSPPDMSDMADSDVPF